MNHQTQLGLYMFLTQLGGILAGSRYLTTTVADGSAIINNSPVSGLYLTAAIIIASGLMLVLFRYKLTFLIKAWFYTALCTTVLMFFLAVTPPGLAVGLTAAVFIVRQFTPSLWTRNIMDGFAYAGAGGLFGAMIGPAAATVFLMLLAVYDTIAVYMTGHMVSMAENSVASNTFMGIMYPKDGSTTAAPSTISMDEDDRNTGVQIGVLGGGDIVAPTLYSISLLQWLGPVAAVTSAAGATAALLLLFTQTDSNEFYPAIPFIAAGCFTGTLLFMAAA